MTKYRLNWQHGRRESLRGKKRGIPCFETSRGAPRGIRRANDSNLIPVLTYWAVFTFTTGEGEPLSGTAAEAISAEARVSTDLPQT